METSSPKHGSSESWENLSDDNAKPDKGMDDNLPKTFSKLNVDAPPFVPSFSLPTSTENKGVDQTSEIQATNLAAAGDVEAQNIPRASNDEPGGNSDDSPAEWESMDISETNNHTGEGDIREDEEEEMEVASKSKKKVHKKEEEQVRKEHVNVVFIGHVDAGKSTIGGQLLYLTGMVDKRTLEKYEKEAKEKNRESWYLSWALDTNQEERDKGKTVEVGRASFETENKHFTLLDAPGHRSFVPNMIGGTCQADLAVLVISARKGEFETGFERGGQTREHAMLAKTAGVRHMVILINKMDDPTVEWSEDRYNECKEKLIPYLKKCGFNVKTDIFFMPCSGLTGAFLREVEDENKCPWYRGPSFLTYIDRLPSFNRSVDGPFKMPVLDKYKEMGTVVLGKVESGSTKKSQQLMLMPNRKLVEVLQLWSDDEEVNSISSGENVKIKLKGIEEEEVSTGFVLCDANNPCKTGKIFDAQVVILEHKSIICPGYSAVLHIHTSIEEVSVKALICLIDKKTGEKGTTRPRFVKQDQIAIMRLECAGVICLESFKEFPQMGRFTLRDEGKTIAIDSNSTARQSSFKLATVSVNCDVEEGAIFLNDLEAKSFKCRGRRLDSSSAMRFGQDPRSPLMILAALAWILSILDRLVLLALIQAGVAYSKIGLTSARYVKLFCIGEVVFGDPDDYVICVKGNFSWRFDRNSVEGLGKIDEGCYSGFCRFMMEAVLGLLNEAMLAKVGQQRKMQRQDGSGRPRATTEREDRAIVRMAVAAPESTLSTIQRVTGTQVSKMTINRQLRERNLRARRPLRCLPLTPVHRQVRLQWCRERSTWNCADWGRIAFSDETRFLLCPDYVANVSGDVLGSVWILALLSNTAQVHNKALWSGVPFHW
ncbi:GSPT1 [Cordylochernes scorpioides]|uniref:GSPT1 n=1 Tax=Cordylochernes scorpioides TaxID=51811 RepID=A0ABY6KDX4_9ARAC|nr:GSPT1 [Cordylochernes scorpioides]